MGKEMQSVGESSLKYFECRSQIVGDYLARIVGSHFPDMTLKFCVPLASFFMVIVSPITFPFLKLSKLFSRNIYFDSVHEQSNQEARQELLDLIEESNISTTLDPHDKKLITSVMAFKDRIAREVMVPRVDVFGLAHDTTIEEAAVYLLNEGYSRTPVFKDTLDDIIGVLMYKDILSKYMEFDRTGDKKILEAPIETLVKSVLYTPETKKISHLLQEFRKKQVHLAIIVDEYGGTEGIVTIEDILEEIVGEIADEYDKEEEALFIALPEGGWLIDARMNIFDINEQFGIEIPQNGDYDTIGGYIFHETGTIPGKGFIIHKPEFELEVVRSNDRRVEKLRIKPIHSENQSDNESSFSP
jgi:putative hemolysin